MNKCLICKKNEATKSNSHIIPSFLTSMVASYDGSYKRGKDLLFAISPYKEQIYIGALPDTKLQSVFHYEELTEERISELSINPVALDYIFCPACECNLSKHLEAPYSECLSKNTQKDPITQLFFWISVIWRMSITNKYGFKLPKSIEDKFHSILDKFLLQKEEANDAKFDDLNFNYRVIHCKDYCKTNGGFIHCKYEEIENVLTIMIGDVCICFTFDKADLPKDYHFFKLEEYFVKAYNNSTLKNEKRCLISKEDYKKSVNEFIKIGAEIKKREYFNLFDELWKRTGRTLYMPMRMKIKFLEMLLDENVKIGERHSKQRMVGIFNELVDNILIWY